MNLKPLLWLTAIISASITGNVMAKEITAWVIDAKIERPFFVQLEKAFNEKYAHEDVTVKIEPIPVITMQYKRHGCRTICQI